MCSNVGLNTSFVTFAPSPNLFGPEKESSSFLPSSAHILLCFSYATSAARTAARVVSFFSRANGCIRGPEILPRHPERDIRGPNQLN
jgi:hypothetical protein